MTTPKKTTTTEPETTATAEVLTAAESAALVPAPAAPTPAAIAPAGRPVFDATPFEDRIAATGDKLRAIAEANPELREKLEELTLYTVARVEGNESSRGVRIPNVQLCQKMTKSESLPGDVKEGNLYTKQMDLGTSLEFIPLHAHFQRTRFVPNSDRPECFSDDGVIGSKWGECAKCSFGKYVEGERPQCSTGRSVSVVTSDFSRLYQIGFSKTSAKTGKRLLDLADSPHGIFKGVYKLTTEKVKGQKGDYFELRVGSTGRQLEGAEFATARALFEFFKARFDMGVERRRAGDTKGGSMLNGNAGGNLPSGGGGDVEPNFADEGLL